MTVDSEKWYLFLLTFELLRIGNTQLYNTFRYAGDKQHFNKHQPSKARRMEQETALCILEMLITVVVKTAKYHANYYPYLWQTLLVEHPPKRRAVLLLTLDALVTSSVYFPTNLLRMKMKNRTKGLFPTIRLLGKMSLDYTLLMLLALGASAFAIAVTDVVKHDAGKFAALCLGTRIMGGVLSHLASPRKRAVYSYSDTSGLVMLHCFPVTVNELATYSMQTTHFSNRSSSRSAASRQTVFGFHQSHTVGIGPKNHRRSTDKQTTSCGTESGLKIAGAVALVKIITKGYIDIITFGNYDVAYYFRFDRETPHPAIPMFLTSYFAGAAIDSAFDILENILQTVAWKLERKARPLQDSDR